MSTTARPAISTLQQIGSERAKKAAQTRRLNKLEEQRQAAQQADLRAQLYAKLTGEQRDQIDSIISTPFIDLDDEYETHLQAWLDEKCEEVAESIRHLLRANVNAKLILAALEENGNYCQFNLDVFGMEINAKDILQSVLLEDEFDGSKKPTREEAIAQYEFTDTYVGHRTIEAEGLDTTGYPVVTPEETNIESL